MRKLSAWFTLGSFVLIGSMTAVGCGSDEATDDDDDGGGLIDAGDGGKEGGTVRDSGSSGGTSRVGRACSTDAECGSEDELFCVTDEDLGLLRCGPGRRPLHEGVPRRRRVSRRRGLLARVLLRRLRAWREHFGSREVQRP